MKPQTFTEWFETVNTPGDRQDYLTCLAAWNARGEQDALIADSYSDDNKKYHCLHCNLWMEGREIAEDIRKL